MRLARACSPDATRISHVGFATILLPRGRIRVSRGLNGTSLSISPQRDEL